MTSTASSSISSRTSALGQRVAEDVLVQRLAGADPEREPALEQHLRSVAAAWATTAGWMRTVGQVTAV